MTNIQDRIQRVNQAEKDLALAIQGKSLPDAFQAAKVWVMRQEDQEIAIDALISSFVINSIRHNR
ncbi:MAG: hypothetical protein OEY59_12460 [Deltaproteobacteria bacterium]|nr:hypothetical protein [Deltaproteobacteria bacterium]